MRILVYLCVLLLLIACQARKPAHKDASELPRPEVGYLHWMHKQSMLGQAAQLIPQVSQSQRLWLQSSEPGRADVLLKAAPNWLELVEDTTRLKSSIFQNLAAQAAKISHMGFGGIYLGETAEMPDIWTSRDGSSLSRKAASFNFDPEFGTEADFEKLAKSTEAAGIELGSDLLAGATGMGPDFFLEARNVPDYSGLYTLLPVSEGNVPLLPIVGEEWDNQALPETAISKLADAGVLPKSVARDNLAWASKGGWATTGPVMGTDGVARRWLYRFSGNTKQPLLSWQDPSGHAARVLQASAIRLTGLLGQSLAGIHFEPLMALEPADSPRISLSPGIDALNEISRQIHRYGGWAMQADPLPPDAMMQVLAGPCDFCRDEITPLLVAYGLIAGDVRPLMRLYRGWIADKMDISRLARGYNASSGIEPRILRGAPAWEATARKLAEFGSAIKTAQIASIVFPNPADAQAEIIRRFFLSWRLGLPGLAFVEFYPASSFNPSDDWLEHVLAARRDSGLGMGRVIAITQGRTGAIGILSKLPEDGYWLLACNFSNSRDAVTISIPDSAHIASDAGDGKSLNQNMNGQNFCLSLDGREARHVLFTKKGLIKPKKAGVIS